MFARYNKSRRMLKTKRTVGVRRLGFAKQTILKPRPNRLALADGEHRMRQNGPCLTQPIEAKPFRRIPTIVSTFFRSAAIYASLS